MKKYLLFLFLTLLLLACKSEAQTIESIQKEVSGELPTMSNQKLTAEVYLSVPDSRWSIKIVKVVQTKNEIAVLCQLSQSDMMGMMVISEVVDAVKFEAQALPIKYYIRGKTWGWENTEPYVFLDALTKFDIVNSDPISFERIEPSKRGGPKNQSKEM